MKEEGSNDATLVLPTSNLREAVPRQVDLEANLPHDPFMQEEGSDDATLVHPASNLREAVTRQVDQEANLLHDQPMQEIGSDDATLEHPTSNILESVIRQIELEANSHHDPFMKEEGSDDATLVNPASNLRKAITRQVYLQAINLWEIFLRHFSLQKKLTFQTFRKFLNLHTNHLVTCHPVLTILEPLSVIGRIMRSLKKLLGEYLENDEKVSKLIKTVEKLEKTAGDIGDFIELLKLQSKRNMCRKRKRSGVALQGFLLVISLELQNAVVCYGEDPYLLVIMLFRANFNLPTGITGYIFIGYIM